MALPESADRARACHHVAVTPRAAVSLLFLVNGFVLANWLTRIPDVARALHLGSGQVGTALLGMAVGALSAFPLTGGLITRFGSARVTVGFAAVYALSLPALALAPSLPWLLVALALFGFGNGGMDVAMNAQGVEVERWMRRPIMNALHGFFSLGGLVGAATGGAVASAAVPVPWHFVAVAVAALVGVAGARGRLRPDEATAAGRGGAPVFTLPARALWGLGAVGVCAAIGEGAIGDWSALYLRGSLGTGPGLAALGYAAFSVTMLIGRFAGDGLVARFGPAAVVRAGGALAAVGLAAGLAVPLPALALVGFAAVGLGLAVVIPLVYAAAGAHPTIPRGVAVAGVATIGYSGFLVGPPLLGWLADLASLRVALLLVAALSGLIVVLPRVDQ